MRVRPPIGNLILCRPAYMSQSKQSRCAITRRSDTAIIDHAADQAESAAQIIGRYVDLGREGMVGSDYGRGCGVAPLIIESATKESADVAETARRSFSEMIDRLAFQFVAIGIDRAPARELAHAVIASVQGAMITSRALHSPKPYDAVRTVLVSQAASVSPKTSARKAASRKV